ncbi:hypothetical protein R50073_42800 [Maricurvus nonylphenolicus]
MDDVRAVIAIFISCISGYLVFDLIANGFSWGLLIAAILGFIIVHILWPRKRDGDSAWYDVLELIFDLPYRCIALCVRGIGRAIKGGDGDIGIDI